MYHINRLLSPLLLAFLLLGLSSCQEKPLVTFSANVPTLVPLDTWRNTAIDFQTPRDLNRMGKTYVHQDLLFVNEVLEGIHIYDNSNPESPINLGFLPIHANLEMVARGDFLYADSYYDLLTFDISDPNRPQLVDRQEDVFLFLLHRRLSSFNPDFPALAHDANTHVVTGWNLEEVTKDEVLDNSCEHPECRGIFFDDATIRGGGLNSTSMIGGVEKSGLNDKIVQRGDYLYALGEESITTYLIPGIPLRTSISLKDRGDISIQATKGYLWLGSNDKFTTYTIDNPAAPINTSWWYDRPLCSPFVVDDNRAYKAQFTGSPCNGGPDQLQVMDISDIHFSSTLATYDLHNPQGLALDNNLLFVAEGEGGLKIFDRTDDLDLHSHLLTELSEAAPHDVYAENGIVTLVCNNGIYQFDYTDPENLVQMSFIQRIESN